MVIPYPAQVSDWLPEPPEVEPRAERAAPKPPSVRNIVITLVCITLLGVCLAWAFLSMRAVMGVGGSCASGGPYEIATPCPDGSWLIAIAIPVLIIASMSGSGFASTIGAPNQLFVMWAVLFGSLGWNFFEFAFEDGVSISFLVCGVLFWGMALPAWWGIGVAFVKLFRNEPRQLGWWAAYAVLLACGAFLGLAVYVLAS